MDRTNRTYLVMNCDINYKTVKGYDLSSYPDVIGKWNQANTLMWEQCKSLGPSYCLPVHYEHLVLEKEKVLRQIGMNLQIFIDHMGHIKLTYYIEHIGRLI